MKRGGRIIYIEPNDASGTVGKTPITPDYTDYSVMFSLSAEIVNRMDYVGVSGLSKESEDVAITWFSGTGEDGKPKSGNVYFTRGSKIDNTDNEYLTTYYTDIDYRNIRNSNIVEGLGVDNIEVALENFYAASVKIRFVDVRGSALFSREEATHSGTRLTSENVFQCFFTMPYPKFTLLVKGYYGKAMTYQLTCVGFNGKFDDKTGNFVADVSFIGYDFGILSDIPLLYVVSAPCDNNIGRAYWDKHKSDPSWQLYGDGWRTEEPVLLVDVFQKIRDAVAKNPDFDFTRYKTASKFSNTIGKGDKASEIKRKIISIVSDSYSSLEKRIISYVTSRNLSDGDGSGLYQVSSSITVSLGENSNNSPSVDYGGDDGAVSSYGDLEVSKYVNEGFVKPEKPDLSEVNALIYEYNSTYSGKKIRELASDLDYVLDTNMTNQTTSSFCMGYRNGETVMNDCVSAVVYYTLDVSETFSDINDVLKEASEEEDAANENVAQNTDCKISELIGFTPYIGNVVKLLMCHLETFIHTIYSVAQEAYDDMAKGVRSPEALGVNNLKFGIDTAQRIHVHHIDNDSQIPPFPGIILRDDDDEGGYLYDRTGWIGDVVKNGEGWAEYKLVTGYVEAAQRKNKGSYENVTDYSETDTDVLPASYIYFKNIWDRWLVSSSEDRFTVDYMMKKFAFVDGFYRDISNVLHINADTIMDCVENESVTSTIYGFLKTIASKHNCKLFAYGDTLSFNPIKDENTSIENITDIFKPFPFSAVRKASSENMMVFMYGNRPSDVIPGGNNGFSDDNLYISDGDKLNEYAEKAFSFANGKYIVPSFGITYGRIDNSFFKNISVSMEVPTVTGESARSMQYIADHYGGKNRKVNFYGQDLYRVLTKYSYICEFDMMGDAQVTPLMYFQLFNIPLFRGTYMIYSVVHRMTNGDMNTHVKGMRMSVDSMPFPEEWFSDDVRKVLTTAGVDVSGQNYKSAEEIVLDVEPKTSYKKVVKDDVISIVMDMYNGLFQTGMGQTPVSTLNNADGGRFFYGIYEYGDDSHSFCNSKWEGWALIDTYVEEHDGKSDGIDEDEVIMGKVRDYYSSIYTYSGLDKVKDPLSAAQILQMYVFSDGFSFATEALNNTYGQGKYTGSTERMLTSDEISGINGDKISDFRKNLCRLIKYKAYTYTKEGNGLSKYRDSWTGKVETCTKKVNEKF